MKTDEIYTTKGFLPLSEVECVESVFENDNEKIIRIDKYLCSTGEWVGNDVHVILKRGLLSDLFQGTMG